MTPLRLTRSQVLQGVLVAAAASGAPALASAQVQVASAYFQQNCAACHTVGGGALVGPDLKGVTERRDREWIVRFILDPQGVVNTGDPTAKALVSAAGGLVMPKPAGITRPTAEALIDLISGQAGQVAPSLAGPPITTRTFTPADVAHGRQLFEGTAALQNGGPACLSCHHVTSVGALGGGRLGPDLTAAFERLKGRQGLGMWLSAPATTTMKSLFAARAFTPAEIEALLAFFEDAAKQPPAAAGPSLTFLLAGAAGAVLGLTVLGWVWRGRFRAVRQRLVAAATSGGTR